MTEGLDPPSEHTPEHDFSGPLKIYLVPNFIQAQASIDDLPPLNSYQHFERLALEYAEPLGDMFTNEILGFHLLTSRASSQFEEEQRNFTQHCMARILPARLDLRERWGLWIHELHRDVRRLK